MVGSGVDSATRFDHLSVALVVCLVMFGWDGSVVLEGESWSVSPLSQPAHVEYSTASPNAAWPSSWRTTSRQSLLSAVENTLPLAQPPRWEVFTSTAATCHCGSS